MKRVVKVFFLVLGVVGSTLVYSQNLSDHNWYFGNTNGGIKFNRVDNKPAFVTNKPFPFGTGGSAVATDPATGNLLFYTDGNIIYDRTFTPMPNGNGLNALATSNQPVVVCAIPGVPDKYFVFTNNATFTTGGTISYSIVDMTPTGFGNSVFPSPPFGDVTAGSKNLGIPALANRSEGMIIVPHANGTDFWLITQQVNSLSYSYTLINNASFTGTFGTVSQNVGLYSTTIGNFSYYKKTKKLAASPQDANTDALIITFDDFNGGFTIDQYILNSGTSTTLNQSIYDIEWSNSGQYLYLSRVGEPGINADVLQYDLLNPTTSLTSILSTPVAKSFGLQMGPDSAMYYLYQTAGGQFLVDTFTKTDTIAAFVKRNTTPLSPGDFKATQFPSFLPRAKPIINADFTFAGTCENSPTAFYPTIIPNADSVRWDFGDGNDTTAWSPLHTFAQPQTFSVSLKAYFQGDSVITTHPVSIDPFPLKIDLVQDTTACQCELPANAALCGGTISNPFKVTAKVSGGTASFYTWSNGTSGPSQSTLSPDKAGYYYVVVQNGTACSAYAGVNVKEYGKQDQRTNVWYFGNNAGIDFNVSPPVALSNSAMQAPEGCAIMCDRNGKAMFYTDGNQVYDKTDAAMPSGVPIGGDPFATQSSMIFPVPGDETLYYIFTTQAINGTSANEVKYSLFDLKQNGGLGLVTLKNQTLFSKSTERITANDNWVIFHEYGNNTFRAYRITAHGIDGPVYTSIGSDHSFQFEQNGEGYMKLGPNNTLAVPISTPGVGNFIELFHFNDSTGEFSNFQRIDLNEPTGQVYGIEFDGRKMFATVTGTPTPSKLFEYWFDYLGVPHLSQPGVSQPAQLGAIQLGPDKQVYVAVNDGSHSGFLGTIQVNPDTLGVSGFTLNGFQLAATTTSTLGLPNFAQQLMNNLNSPGFTWAGVCFVVGDSTRFAGTARDVIDSFTWSFGDATGSSTKSAPAHFFAAPGTYTVSMLLHNRCAADITITHQVTIFAPPPPPTIISQPLCNGPVVLDANNTNIPGLTYLWSDGETTKTVTISQNAVISVINTDVNGCHSTAQAFLFNQGPVIDFGPDQTVCQSSAGLQLDALNPGATYTWTTPAGVIASVGQKQAVDIFSPATLTTPQTYSVTVTDPAGCTATDQITYTVKASPTFTFTGTNPAGGCGTPTGTVTLTLTGPDNVLYQYFIAGPTAIPAGFDKPKGFTTGVIPGLVAGVYSAIVVDEVSQCTTSTAVALSDASVSITPAPASTCTVIPITGTTTISTVTDPAYVISVVDGTGLVVDPGTNNTTVNFTSAALPAGSYIVTAKNPTTTCVASANATITALNPSIPFTLTSNVCTAPNQTITASPAAGPTYTWAGPGIVSQAGNVLTVKPGNGPHTYTATAQQAGFCNTDQTIDIVVTDQVIPSFVQSDPCASLVNLTASPSNPSLVYKWYLKDPGTGTLSIVAAGPQTSVTTPGDYVIETTDPVNGCTNTSSPAVAVNINGAITVALNVGLTCNDGKPFTLTATTATPGVTYSWFLDNTVIPGASAATLDQTSEGTYKVTVSKSPCSASTQVEIIRFPIPEGEMPSNWVICNDPENLDPTTSQVELKPGDFTSYNWFKNELTLGVTDPTYIADSEGLYRVDLKNSFGCTGSDQTKVENNCEPVVNAPNAFRPASGEALNNQFQVFSHFIIHDSFEIYVYNRWGELVYHSDKYDFRWNGSFNGSGQPMPGGMYAYVIKYVSSYEPTKGVQEKHGGVVLLK